MAQSPGQYFARRVTSRIVMDGSENILLCCEQYPPSVGGVQEVMRQIAERLAAMGHRVTVATSRHPERGQDVIRNGVRVVSFAISGNAVKGLSGDIGEYQSFLSNSDFDAILIKAAQQWTFDACVSILDELRARKTFIPCGFSALQNPDYAEYFAQMPLWLKKFDALIFYSNAYQDIDFARKNGLQHLHVVPNGVDEREFFEADAPVQQDRLGVPPESLLLLSVGTLIVAKGHWEVIKAYRKANLRKPSCLVINGNSPKEFLPRKIARSIRDIFQGYLPLGILIAWVNVGSRINGAQKTIRLVDLSRERLVALYKLSDVFVFASHIEYSPLVLFEAAAAGTPFISSDVGNAREIAAWTGVGKVIGGRTCGSNGAACDSQEALARQLEIECNIIVKYPANEMSRRFNESGLTWGQIAIKYWVIMRGSSIA